MLAQLDAPNLESLYLSGVAFREAYVLDRSAPAPISSLTVAGYRLIHEPFRILDLSATLSRLLYLGTLNLHDIRLDSSVLVPDDVWEDARVVVGFSGMYGPSIAEVHRIFCKVCVHTAIYPNDLFELRGTQDELKSF